MRIPRLRRSETTDGTQRFTAAWVLALSAVGVLVVGGSLLATSALARQERLLESVERLEAHREAASELHEQLESLATPETRLTDVVTAAVTFDTTADAAATQLGPRWSHTAAVDEIARSIRSLDEDDTAAIAAILVKLDEHELTLAGSATGLVGDAQAEAREPTTTLWSILYATLALLVVEAFLVFRPATQRIQQTLEVRRRQAEDERLRSQKQLEMLARYDHLTGLANRMMFRDRLEHAVATAARTGKQVALMFIDLDKFKDVNDQLGHDAGDELLIEVAERLQEIARRTDTIARIGGDEFTVILEGLDSADGAANVAQKILDSLSVPIGIGDREVQITGSIGIAMYPGDAEDTEDLLRNADTAMYHAKAEGKNNFQFSTDELREASIARLQLIQDLRTAVQKERLRLVYQPQVDLRTDRVAGVEAFIRWVRPDGSEVPAGEFIEVAEDTDLMVPLGEWVIREACEQAMRWKDEGLPSLRIAVNVSARQFRQPNLPTFIATTLNETGMDATELELEVTEGSLVEDIEGSSATLRLLKGIGVRVAIDDFGTGYSSLTYLKQFPIDALKIDDSFMTGIQEQTSDQDVVPSAVAGLAKSLGMETVAEGVETAAQLAFLRRIDVNRAQGFHLSPPLEPHDLVTFVRRRAIRSVTDRPETGSA